MSNKLTTFIHEELGNVRMVTIDNKPYAVARDVAKGLEYSNVSDAVSRHCKGVVKFDTLTSGGIQTVNVIPKGDIIRLIVKAADQSINPVIQEKAQKMESWIFDTVIPAVIDTGHYEKPEYKLLLAMNDRILSLESKIDKRYKPQVNPGYIYKCAWNDYQRITGDESKRGMNGALNDYIGGVPYASQIRPVSVTDWVCKNIGTEVLEQFIADIDDGLIVKSKAGHWVNLGGYACNDVEWAKVLNEFDHKCAYCNASEDDVPLMPEHIIAQSVLSAVHPEKVDLIGNIVPACGKCNESKGTQDMVTWYRKHPEFSEYNLQKIQRYQYKYEV